MGIGKPALVTWSVTKLVDPGSIFSRTSTQSLKIVEEKVLPLHDRYLMHYIDMSKWLDFASSRIRMLKS